jgi:hypothetical protein
VGGNGGSAASIDGYIVDPAKGISEHRSLPAPRYERQERPRVITRETRGSDLLKGEGQGFSQRAAASAVSSGRVLNAIEALGADLRTAFTISSKRSRLLGGIRIPPPITMQS